MFLRRRLALHGAVGQKANAEKTLVFPLARTSAHLSGVKWKVVNAETEFAMSSRTRALAHRTVFGTRIWVVRTTRARSTVRRKVVRKTHANGMLVPTSARQLIAQHSLMRNRAQRRDASLPKTMVASKLIANIGRDLKLAGQTCVRGRMTLARKGRPPPPQLFTCSNLAQNRVKKVRISALLDAPMWTIVHNVNWQRRCGSVPSTPLFLGVRHDDPKDAFAIGIGS